MRYLLAVVALVSAFLLGVAPVCAQTVTNPPSLSVSTINGVPPDASGNATVLTNFLGSFPIASLPACTTGNNGKIAYATDLGGGANTVKCVAGFWQHLTLGAPATIAATSGTITITPLASAPIQLVTGNILSSLLLSVSATNLYPGFMLYVRRPGLLTGLLNVQLSTGGSSLPVLGSSTGVFVYDGTNLVQIQ